MLFTSLEFFAFLPLALLIFAALPVRQRWIGLLLASYLFYGFAQPINLIYLGVVTAVVYASGRVIASAEPGPWRKLVLSAALIVILGSLFAFKFFNFIAGEVSLVAGQMIGGEPLAIPRIGISTPVGYSFYAFSAASYLIDVYMAALPRAAGAADVALYIAWFPKILAGPIERATTFLPQLWQGLRANPDRLVLGLQLIVWGLFKKVVIAENLAPLVDRNFKIAAFAAPMELLISVYFFAFQIYCDFSGYTDIAIGISSMFGIQLMENFRRPYLARSTAEFWSDRWHISLAHWFRDYLYIPLGGGRAGAVRRYLNVMVVFMVSGLWHAGLGYGVGWTFLIWGALNGFYNWVGLATRDFWHRLGSLMPRLAGSTPLWVLRALITFHLVAIAWVFFRAKSIGDALVILKRIATRLPELPGLIPNYPFTSEHYLGFGLILFLLMVEIVDEKRPILQRLQASPTWLRWGVNYAVVFALLLLGRWGTKEFIYMQF
jgi:D-alanyl-lipoteichoic acid acyltransferase DltB (MBOAT superfamily)